MLRCRGTSLDRLGRLNITKCIEMIQPTRFSRNNLSAVVDSGRTLASKSSSRSMHDEVMDQSDSEGIEYSYVRCSNGTTNISNVAEKDRREKDYVTEIRRESRPRHRRQ